MNQFPSDQEEAPPSYEWCTSQSSQFAEFRSYVYSQMLIDEEIKIRHFLAPEFMPSASEVAAHLKLMKAFGRLKESMLQNSRGIVTPEEYEHRWKVFVTIAVRRFIMFVSALKMHASRFTREPRKLEASSDNRSQEFTRMANKLIPPMDVLMVWHAFLMNPMSFYDVFVRNDMYYFINYPFPLHLIDSYIDDTTFDYRVPHETQTVYLLFVVDFATEEPSLEYDIDLSTLLRQKVTLHCPHTGVPISSPVPLTSPDHCGFVDRCFITENLGPALRNLDLSEIKPLELSHDVLRKIILDHDIQEGRLLQGSVKNSSIISNIDFPFEGPIAVSESIADRVAKSSQALSRTTPDATLEEILHQTIADNEGMAEIETLILFHYDTFNPVSLTVPHSVLIGEDLVEFVIREGEFVERINDLDWVLPEAVRNDLTRTLAAYESFFELLAANCFTKTLLPPLVIQLLLQTHQLMLYGYIRDCKYSICETLIDNNDKVGQNRLRGVAELIPSGSSCGPREVSAGTPANLVWHPPPGTGCAYESISRIRVRLRAFRLPFHGRL
ncbi:hypothetical protein Cantr_05839 [Candida viswanathii]|uniref:Uncharacterized protein n=1 Tax=Candida viswanathii TaxID=5486 RepID=A0A367XSM3_9ASCO|nr:hypothetical protein Cantr_05839 [Candida viswanathii]